MNLRVERAQPVTRRVSARAATEAEGTMVRPRSRHRHFELSSCSVQSVQRFHSL